MSSRLIQKIRDLHRFGTAGKLLTIGVLVMAVLALTTHSAHAQSLFGIANAWDFLMKILASFMNVVLSVSSWFVALTGTLLNVSINLTMHIRDFVNSTPAIYDVWKAIRDISGMFIIFGLMYASIRMILGKDAKLGQTIKNIVVAGVLINFSFFITGLCIDASNIVSLQLYNAITPGQPDIGKLINSRDAASVGTLPQIVNTLFSDGGLSAVFMQSLQLQTTFNSKNLGMSDPSAGISTPFRIILIGTTGVVIMITAGLSFLFASLAFVIRLVLLLILLAFSPIWFAAAIIPQLKEYADEWWKVFKNQLIFMPAYLLFMYVALRIISNSNLFNTGAYGSLWKGAQTNALVPTEFISFAINAALIIVMLNIPLLAAIKLGAVTGGLLDGKKMGADILWKKVGGFAGRNTLGKAAYGLRESRAVRSIERLDPRVGAVLNKGLSNVANAQFGGAKKTGYEDSRKKRIDAYKKLADHAKYTDEEVSNLTARQLPEKISSDPQIMELSAELERARAERERVANRLMSGGGDAATQQELNKVNEDIDTNIPAEIEERRKSLEKEIGNQIKGEMAKKWEEHGTGTSAVSKATANVGNLIFGKSSSKAFGKAVADAIRKKKGAAEQIKDALAGDSDFKASLAPEDKPKESGDKK